MAKVPTGMELKENETVLRYAKRSWRSFSFWIISAMIWFILGLFNPLIFLMALVLLAVIVIKKFSSEYAVTAERIYCRKSFTMGKSIEEMELQDIHEIDISQNPFSQSLKVGDMNVRMLDPDEYITLKGIKYPEGWKDYIEKVKEKQGTLKQKVLETKQPVEDDEKRTVLRKR